MIVKSMNESAICAIGHAFGYYDYGEETGMVYAFFGQEPTAQYICAYVRGMLRGGFLHTTSERGEGYIAYKRPKEKLGFKTLWPIATGMLHNSSMKRLMRFAMAIKKGGKSLQERMDKEKKPYIFVGMRSACWIPMLRSSSPSRKTAFSSTSACPARAPARPSSSIPPWRRPTPRRSALWIF